MWGIPIDTIIDLALCLAWSFSLAVFAIPPIIRVAHDKGLLDQPNDRTVHLKGTPRLGGLAIFAGFISAAMIFGKITPEIQRMIAACLLLFFIGIKDDITEVSPFKKFFIQFIAAGLVVFIADIRLTNFQGFLGLGEIEHNISYGLTILTILMITNAINLLDGLDGLAGGISLVILAIFAFFFLGSSSLKYQAYGLLTVSMCGGILGFLRFNFYKAKIFMGDTGSLLIGFVVAVLSVEFVELKPTDSSPALAIAVLVVPVFDTLRVFAMRIIKGKSPFSPDKNHVHHVMLSLGLTQLQTVGLLMLFNVMAFFVVYNFSGFGNNTLILLMAGLLLFLAPVLSLVHRKKQTT